ADDARAPELTQVVRDEVLRLAHELHELADSPITVTELGDQLPSQRVAQQAEDLGRISSGAHSANISGPIDSLPVDGYRAISLLRRVGARVPSRSRGRPDRKSV